MACNHSTDAALRDPPAGSWAIAVEVDSRGRVLAKRIVCRECGAFFGRIVETPPRKRGRNCGRQV